MVYIRTKKVKGNTYYYLCKTVREDGRVRQVTLAYLGTEEPGERKVSSLKKKHSKKG